MAAEAPAATRPRTPTRYAALAQWMAPSPESLPFIMADALGVDRRLATGMTSSLPAMAPDEAAAALLPGQPLPAQPGASDSLLDNPGLLEDPAPTSQPPSTQPGAGAMSAAAGLGTCSLDLAITDAPGNPPSPAATTLPPLEHDLIAGLRTETSALRDVVGAMVGRMDQLVDCQNALQRQMSAVTSQLTAVAAITTNVQHRKDNKLATDQADLQLRNAELEEQKQQHKGGALPGTLHDKQMQCLSIPLKPLVVESSGGPNPAGHVIQPPLFPATYADIWRLDHDGVDALAVAMHEDFGSRSTHLGDRQMRFAAFVGAHPSAGVRIFGEHHVSARDSSVDEAKDDAAGGGPDDDVQDM